MQTSYEIATYISTLLNKQNELTVKYTPQKIMNSRTLYIWLYGDTGIDGVVGLEKDNYLMTRVKHLSVQPNLRRKGIGEKLLRHVLSIIDTKFAYSTVKENNVASLSLCQKLGFKIVAKYITDSGTVFLLVKEMNA